MPSVGQARPDLPNQTGSSDHAVHVLFSGCNPTQTNKASVGLFRYWPPFSSSSMRMGHLLQPTAPVAQEWSQAQASPSWRAPTTSWPWAWGTGEWRHWIGGGSAASCTIRQSAVAELKDPAFISALLCSAFSSRKMDGVAQAGRHLPPPRAVGLTLTTRPNSYSLFLRILTASHVACGPEATSGRRTPARASPSPPTVRRHQHVCGLSRWQAQSPVRRSVAHLPSAAHMHRRRSLTTQVNGMSATASQLQASLGGISAPTYAPPEAQNPSATTASARVLVAVAAAGADNDARHTSCRCFIGKCYRISWCNARQTRCRVRQKDICDEVFVFGSKQLFQWAASTDRLWHIQPWDTHYTNKTIQRM